MISKKKSYRGILATPILHGKLLAAALRSRGAQNQDLVVDTLFAHRARCFQLLFEHYGIEPGGPDAWNDLAHRLAFDHVPGLSIGEAGKRGRGRPPTKLPKELMPAQAASVKKKPGPKPTYSDQDVDAIAEYLPTIQKNLKDQKKPATRQAAINCLLDKVVKATGQRIPDRKGQVKTLLNRISIRSRVTAKK